MTCVDMNLIRKLIKNYEIRKGILFIVFHKSCLGSLPDSPRCNNFCYGKEIGWG